MKCELVLDSPPYLAPPRRFGTVWVDDLLCIAVNKLAILTRFEPRDYVDLYLIIRSGAFRPEDLIPHAKAKVVGLDEWALIGKFQRIRQLENVAEFQRRYLLVEVAWEEVVRFYMDGPTGSSTCSRPASPDGPRGCLRQRGRR